MSDRLIFHIDVNSAFLSWTSVKRLQNGLSDLRNIPAVIGGSPDKRTSIVAAKSIPAKKYGIRTGEPVSMALQKCPGLVIAPPDFTWYEICSRRFIDICGKYTARLEQFSIDECFLDMTDSASAGKDPVAMASRIKDEIRDTLGFTVNVGIGDNKLLAKMASDFEKPDKVHTLYKSEIPQKMWPLPAAELLFVGRSTAGVLAQNGIRTIGELAAADEAYLASFLGKNAAHRCHQFANGIDNSPVSDIPREAKSFSVSTTLEADVTESSEAHAVIREICDSVCYRMREAGWKARGIGIQIRSGDYSVREDRSRQKKLETPTDITREVYDAAVELFDSMWDGEKGIRLFGIRLFDLTKEAAVQLDLFGTEEKREKMEKADHVMDEIRKKYGPGAISQGMPSSHPRIGLKFRAQIEAEKQGDSDSAPVPLDKR